MNKSHRKLANGVLQPSLRDCIVTDFDDKPAENHCLKGGQLIELTHSLNVGFTSVLKVGRT